MSRREVFNLWRDDQLRNTAIIDGGYRAWLWAVLFPAVEKRMLG